MALHWQILLALVLGVGAGIVTGGDGMLLGLHVVAVYTFVGTLFIQALKMIIVPLVVSSIIHGVGSVSGGENIGRISVKTLFYYLATSLIAILVGLLLVNLIQPGIVNGQAAGHALGLDSNTYNVSESVRAHANGHLSDIFLRMVPSNVVQAAASGQMLGLIFFSLLFGYFVSQVKTPAGEQVRRLVEGILDTMMRMTLFIMRFAPLGVFALVARVVAETGLDAFRPLATFFITVIVALLVHAFVIMPLILRFLARVNPMDHFRAMMPALLTAFSSASSSATLPLTLECMEKRAGVSNRVSSFVLPLGSTVNMDGTALYECVAAMFIAQAYGLHLDFTTQFTVVLLALLTSIGVAGIPAASLVAIVVILTAVGLPAEAVGIILATDRVLDMCRTAVNVWGDSCGTTLIARSEGEQLFQQPDGALKNVS